MADYEALSPAAKERGRLMFETAGRFRRSYWLCDRREPFLVRMMVRETKSPQSAVLRHLRDLASVTAVKELEPGVWQCLPSPLWGMVQCMVIEPGEAACMHPWHWPLTAKDLPPLDQPCPACGEQPAALKAST